MTWLEKYRRHNGSLEPLIDNYRETMTGAGAISDLSFFDGKIVVDVGSGPACTLCWIANAKARIGIDPLAERFMQLGIASHDMLYLDAPGENVPLPSGYVDVVFSINALDHVEDPVAVMNEIDRILRPGGHFIGSIGFKEEPTFTEPHVLTRQFIETHLFQGWSQEFSKIRPKGPSAQEFYRFFSEEPPPDYKADELIWWCRYRKPSE
jgi:SAM-dependent methyltransferase